MRPLGGSFEQVRDESDTLHARARAFVRAFEEGLAPPESFESFFFSLVRYQTRSIEGYGRLCRARGVELGALDRTIEVPAVPTEAFKLAHVGALPVEEMPVVFRTSGTTVGQRGTHRMRDTETYDRAALAFGKRALAGDFAQPFAVLVLGPPPSAAPDSSLTHMLEMFVRTWGRENEVASSFLLDDGVFDVVTLDERISKSLVSGEPVLVLATSFALVHLLDAMGDDVMRLPPRSRVMQTGGFKGRSREIAPAELRAKLARLFAVGERSILGEYGMTELSSQFYESDAVDLPPGIYLEPPWARVIPVHPETLLPVADGEIGIARIEDLMNVDSAAAVLTADRVRRVGPGFELLGRLESAPPRGCSLTIDEMFEAHINGSEPRA